MTQILKQSTSADVLIGPFVDSGDGYTAETGLSPSVKLSKNGQALGAKNDATTPVHDADGYYNCELDATDTNTVGTLVLSVAGSATALPVRHEFQVLDGEAYDALYASTATLLSSDDIGLMYKSTIGTVSSQTVFLMDTDIVSSGQLVGKTVTCKDASAAQSDSRYITAVNQATEEITINAAFPWTVVAGDTLRVFKDQHPSYALSAYSAVSTTETDLIQNKMTAYVQLLARKDAAIATDNSTELSEINNDEGSGLGAYDNATDSLEANQDDITTVKAKTDQLSFGVANSVDANITNVAGGSDLTSSGTGSQNYGES